MNVSEKFFRMFYSKMRAAHEEIKATVTVNTSDLSSKNSDATSSGKENEKGRKSRGISLFQGCQSKNHEIKNLKSQDSKITMLAKC